MIFISHKTKKDHGHALLLKHLLEEQGYTCWIAPEDIEPGSDYEYSIRAAIGSCQILLVVVSRGACEKPAEIVKEIQLARQDGKRIIPIKFGTFELTGDLFEELKHVQYKSIGVGVDDCDALLEEVRLEMESDYCMSIDRNRTFSLARGAYTEIMQSIIDGDLRAGIDSGSCMFAMGVNSKILISENNEGGIFPHVCKLLKSEYGIDESDLQAIIDEALLEQHGFDRDADATRELRYGECTEVHLTLPPSKPLQLLLVVNSRTPDPSNPNLTEGPDPRKVILDVFDWCEKNGNVDNLVIGAMGTGNVKKGGFGFPYDVVVAEIANATLCAKRREAAPKNVICTVRNEDLERHGLPIGTLTRYLWNVRDYFDRSAIKHTEQPDNEAS